MHLATADAAPNAIEENAAKIVNRVREDGEARAAELQRFAEEQAIAAREADWLRLEEERKQERSEGGGISMS